MDNSGTRPPEKEPIVERWSNRTLWRLCWPLVIEQMLSVTIGLVDTVMVTVVGEASVSGVSLVDSINVLLINLFASLATGGAVVASQYLGRKDRESASLAAKQLIYAVFVLSVLVMGVALAANRQLLALIYGNIEPEVSESAVTYFWLSALSFPFIGLYNAGAALFRSQGNSRVGMWVAGLVNLLNIAGNSLFIFGFGWGVGGAAISTLISRAVAAVVVLFLLTNKRGSAISVAGLFRFRLVPAMIARILRIGVPSGLENSLFQVGKLITSRIITTFGTAAIAGNAIANVLASFANIPGNAISMALLTVVGQCVGARDYPAARRYTWKLLKAITLVIAVACGGVLASLRPLVGLFGLSPDAARVAVECMRIFCIPAILFWPASFALPNALRAAGDARFTMLVSIFSMWAFRVGFSYLFAYTLGMGASGVWAAMVVDWIARGIFFVIRWRGGKWEKKRLIQ